MLQATSKMSLTSYQNVQEKKDNLLVAFDVINLCTNIPRTFGLEGVDYRLENHPESLHARFNPNLGGAGNFTNPSPIGFPLTTQKR